MNRPAGLFKSLSVCTAGIIAGVCAVMCFTSYAFLEKRDIREEIPDGCTSIIVGRLASTDGSTITSHTCDGPSRTWIEIVPHKKHEKGSTVKAYNMKTRRTEFPGDLRELVVLGEIPQVEETFAYLDTSYPSMNEYQLAIGETTIGGRRELRSDNGIFLIEQLQKVVLQRAKTAREAIRLMGMLAEKYGYVDTGECMTFIDPKEAWYFEIFGPGKGRFGAVWAAVRIPDGHVGVSANIPRIAGIDVNDPDNYMASENIFSLAEEMGWWDSGSGETFKVWKAYSGRRPFSIREYWILSSLAPSLNLDYDADELPFSVKPDKKVSPRDVMRLLRSTYSGSKYDMRQNLKVKDRRTEELVVSSSANPWMSRGMVNMLNSIQSGVVERQRTVSVNSCAYSTVIQCRDWLPDPVGCIVWFGLDNPAHTSRIPIFAGVTRLPEDFAVSSQHKFRTDSASWAVRRVSRLAQLKWEDTKDEVNKLIGNFEEKAFFELPVIEKKAVELYKKNPEDAKEFLTQYTCEFARSVIHAYWELGDKLWMNFAQGF